MQVLYLDLAPFASMIIKNNITSTDLFRNHVGIMFNTVRIHASRVEKCD